MVENARAACDVRRGPLWRPLLAMDSRKIADGTVGLRLPLTGRWL